MARYYFYYTFFNPLHIKISLICKNDDSFWYLSIFEDYGSNFNPSNYIDFIFKNKIKFDNIYYVDLEYHEIMYLKLMRFFTGGCPK